MHDQTIARRIAARLEATGQNPDNVAESVGVRGPTVRNWLKGTASPNAKYLAPLSRALRCSPLYLLGLTDRVGRPA